MAALILPSRRVVQPQGPVEVDWANPIARGLVGFWYPDGQLFRSAINGYPDGIPTVNATFDAAGKGRKIGRVGTAARSATIARDVRQRPGVKMTLLAEGVAPSRVNSGQNYWLGAEASSAGFGVYLTSAGLRPYLRVGGTFADQISGVLAGQSAQVGFTFSGSTYWVVADGKQKVSQSISGAINHSTVDLALTSISGSGSNLGDGSFYYLAIWDRDLSALELDSFYGNPWQVLRPIQRRIIVDMGAGGATNYNLTAVVGAYSLTGIDATLTYTPAAVNYSLTADAGAYALAGVDAGVTFGRRLLADAGSYSLTGIDATLAYVPGGGAFTLTADTGAYGLNGNDAGLTFARSMTADVGSYTLNGVDAGLQLGRRLTADTGAYALAGLDADLVYTALGPTAYTLTCDAGSYTLEGVGAVLRLNGAAGSNLTTAAPGLIPKVWPGLWVRYESKPKRSIEELEQEERERLEEIAEQAVIEAASERTKKAMKASIHQAMQAAQIELTAKSYMQLVEQAAALRTEQIEEEEIAFALALM